MLTMPPCEIVGDPAVATAKSTGIETAVLFAALEATVTVPEYAPGGSWEGSAVIESVLPETTAALRKLPDEDDADAPVSASVPMPMLVSVTFEVTCGPPR